jgi:hypothetical protein
VHAYYDVIITYDRLWVQLLGIVTGSFTMSVCVCVCVRVYVCVFVHVYTLEHVKSRSQFRVHIST